MNKYTHRWMFPYTAYGPSARTLLQAPKHRAQFMFALLRGRLGLPSFPEPYHVRRARRRVMEQFSVRRTGSQS